jgi:outer membrane protein assembly factor BamB
VYSSPAIANGKVLIGSNDGNVYCLDVRTGDKIWNYTTGYNVQLSSGDSGTWVRHVGSVSSSPAVVNGMVYVGSEDGNVYAFHSASQLASAVSAKTVIVIFSVIIVLVLAVIAFFVGRMKKKLVRLPVNLSSP